MSEIKELEYVVLTPDDLPDVADLLTKHYYPRENITVGAGLNPVDLTAGAACQGIRASLASGLSVGARARATGRLVALTTSNIITSPPKYSEAMYTGDHFAKSYKISEVCWRKVDVFQEPGVELVLEIERACVHPDYGRRGVLKDMVEMSMALGTKHGCQLAHAEVTSPYSEKVFIRLGFDTRFILDFHTLEDVMLDLSLMTYKFNKVMTKRLPLKTTIPSKLEANVCCSR